MAEVRRDEKSAILRKQLGNV
ncbi:MAG: hypothetical protein JWN78_1180, partial [Bacteroidota bacterium]|nr:hypothetical protein [Bacteroidota bacterium]